MNKAEPDLPSKKNRVKSVGLSDENGAVAEHTSPKTPPATELPAVIKSPAHDTKVRQIRKRVKNLSWKDGQRKLQDSATDDVDAQDEGPETVDPGSDGKGGDDDTSKSVSAKSDSDKEDVPGAVKKSAGLANEPAEVPESDSRTDADIVDAAGSPSKTDADTCSGKRRRDDEDVNPREKTRLVTPPPDKERGEVTGNGTDKPKSAAAPLVSPGLFSIFYFLFCNAPCSQSGFARYAGASSPFATANTANVFGTTSKHTFGGTAIPQPSIQPQNDTGTKHTPSALFGSSGFGKYASSSSPFASAKPSAFNPSTTASNSGSRSPSRSKSPARHANAFESYSNRSGKFAATTSRPSKKQKKLEESPAPDSGEGSSNASGDENEGGDGAERPKSFDEILTAKDEAQPAAESSGPKTVYKEQEGNTLMVVSASYLPFHLPSYLISDYW